MRSLLFSLIALALVPTLAEQPAVPVVVELFTSEGCESCPRADTMLRTMAAKSPIPGVEIVPLAYHVDYWDSPFWKDPFSSAAATRRQQRYLGELGVNGPYTPQMVVDGAHEFVGSDRKSAMRALMIAQSRPRATMRIDHDESWSVTIDALPEIDGPLHLSLVLREGELGGHEITGGENIGRTLRHDAVVRHFSRIAEIPADTELPLTVPVTVALDADWNTDNLTAVVILQRGAAGPILGVATRELAGQ